jgi:hypothetical protein
MLTPADRARVGVQRLGLELTTVPALAGSWWAGKRAASRRRLRAVATAGLLVGVVALCTAGWWDPAIDAVFGAIGGWIVNAAVDAIAEASTQFMSLAFNNPLTEISEGEWAVAIRQASRWGAVFAVVAVGACAVEVVASLIARDAARALRAGIIAATAWPMTVAAILALAELVAITDGLSGQMFDNVAGDGATGSAAAASAMGAAMGGLTAATLGVSAWPLVVIGALVCIVGLLMIAMVMSARAFGLLVATGMAPIALMLVGFKGTRGMARKWVEVVAGLLLAKPLAAGIIVLCLELAGEGSLDSFIMGTVGLWVAVFSPAMAMSLVSFAGAHLGAAMTAHASAFKNLAAQATQAAATRLALEGPNSEGLSKLAHDTAGLVKAGIGGLDTMVSSLGSKLNTTPARDDEGSDDGAPDPAYGSDDPTTTPQDGPGDTEDTSTGDGTEEDGDLASTDHPDTGPDDPTPDSGDPAREPVTDPEPSSESGPDDGDDHRAPAPVEEPSSDVDEPAPGSGSGGGAADGPSPGPEGSTAPGTAPASPAGAGPRSGPGAPGSAGTSSVTDPGAPPASSSGTGAGGPGGPGVDDAAAAPQEQRGPTPVSAPAPGPAPAPPGPAPAPGQGAGGSGGPNPFGSR